MTRPRAKRYRQRAAMVLVAVLGASLVALAYGSRPSTVETASSKPVALSAYPVPAGAQLLDSFSFENATASSKPIFASEGWIVYQAAPGRFRTGSRDPAPVEEARWGRFEVRPGDPLVANGPRAQISAAQMADGTITQACGRWYVPSYSDLPGPFHSWEILYEEHPTNPAVTPLLRHPPEALWLVGARGRPYAVRLASGTGLRRDWQSRAGAFKPNTWHSFCLRAFWSQTPSGWVELWIDGKWRHLNNGSYRKYEVTMPSPTHYPIFGIYDGDRSVNRQHSVTFMDELRVWSIARPGSMAKMRSEVSL